MSTVAGILLLAGSGHRFQRTLPKQFQFLSGKPLYRYALDSFCKVHALSQIILVTHPDYTSSVYDEVSTYHDSRIKVIAGGTTRQESSLRGLKACDPETEFVIIHDGVRPFVTEEIIQANLTLLQHHPAVDTCIPSSDTIVHTPDTHSISHIPPRGQYYRGQTPQSFSYPLICKAHEQAQEEGITNASDDCQLLLRLGKPIEVCQGSEHNIKITTELDLLLAEQILRTTPEVLSSQQSASLHNHTYAVIGGTGGIGSVICKELKKQGAYPLPLGRSDLDIRDHFSVQRFFHAAYKKHGPLDGLINCAGSLTLSPLKDLSFESIQDQITTNLLGVVYSCKCAILRPHGHIINVASSAFSRGRKNYSIYSAAKAAVVNFTQALAEEMPHLHINTIIPHRTKTAMRIKNFPGENPALLMSPEEVARCTITLLKTTTVTGAIIDALH